MTVPVTSTGRCPDCGHPHTGPQLGGICVDCPCQTRTGQEDQ